VGEGGEKVEEDTGEEGGNGHGAFAADSPNVDSVLVAFAVSVLECKTNPTKGLTQAIMEPGTPEMEVWRSSDT
jgi:hypothetical protein